MRMQTRTALVISGGIWLGICQVVGGGARAQQPLERERPAVDFAKREFDANCAVCHGADGRGVRPYSRVTSKTVPDLTTLARRNGGLFPFERVYKFIDGTQGHEPRDMPAWADVYKFRPEKSSYIILELSNYLHRLQRK
jgi:hypothetical protein